VSSFLTCPNLQHANFRLSALVGPIVGGAVGGFVVIALIISAVLLCRRRKPPRQVTRVDPWLNPVTFEARPTPYDPMSNSPQPSRSSLPAAENNEWRTNPFPQLQHSAPTYPASENFLSPSDAEAYLSMTDNPDSRARSTSSRPFTVESFINTDVQSVGSPSQAASVPTGNMELTEEQAAILRDLRSSNVPPAEIAYLMEVMRRGGEVGMGTGVS
jgi:hypothetical protein